MRNKTAGFALAVGIVFGGSVTLAQEQKPASREQAIDQAKQAIDKDTTLSPETREALSNLMQSLKTEPQPAAAGEKSSLEKFFDRLKPFADFRLRNEDNFHLDDQDDRYRARIRFRVGTTYQVLDELMAGARMTTGQRDDAQTPHVTLGEVFHKFDFNLDRVYVTYRPSWFAGSSATAGKFGHPFYANPVYGELVWDADVQPEGGVLGYTYTDTGSFERFDAYAGEYYLLEQGNADDAYITVVQLSARCKLCEHVKATAALGLYDYGSVSPDGSTTLVGENSGNATVDLNGDGTPDRFQSHFQIWNPIVSCTYDGLDLPLTASAEYIYNADAENDRDQGYAIGAAYGRTEKQGDWRFYYQWQVVEQDAVFSPVAQDDFLLSTNHRSHIAGANYQIADNVGVQLWALVSSREATGSSATTDSDKDQWRVRLDLNVRF